jgi:hypothetical protein
MLRNDLGDTSDKKVYVGLKERQTGLERKEEVKVILLADST